MTQIGLAIGISVSTIVFDGVLKAQSSRLGVSLNAQGDNAPMAAQLKAYKAAMWTGSAFGILGVCYVGAPGRLNSTHCTFTGMILCFIFLRGVGIVVEKPTQDRPDDLNPEKSSVDASDNSKAESPSPA